MRLQLSVYHEKRPAMEGFLFNVYAYLQGPKVHWHLAKISRGYKLAYMLISRAIWSVKKEPYLVILAVCRVA